MDLFDLDPQPEEIGPHQLAWSFREARIVQVATRLGLFTQLAQGPLGAWQLAQALRCDPDMTERLLVALAALGLLHHDHDLWQNSLPAALYLVEGQPLYLGESIELAAEWWDVYHDLERLVREGRQGERYRYWQERRLARTTRYLQARHALACAGQAQRLARHLSALSGRRTLLDVGGAPGSYSVALCQRFPQLRVTLMEAAEALPLCKQVVQQFGLEERIQLKEGEWQQAPLGEEAYGALLMSHSLVGSDAQALLQLMRAYEALKAGGLLIVQSFLLDSDWNGGRPAALAHLLGHSFTLEQMRSMLAEAGFERITLLFRAREGNDIFIAYKPLAGPTDPEDELLAHVSPEQEIFALMGMGEGESDGLTVQRRMWERMVQNN